MGLPKIKENVKTFLTEENVPSVATIEKFLMKILLRMKLSNEVCLLALIFIEKVVKLGGV